MKRSKFLRPDRHLIRKNGKREPKKGRKPPQETPGKKIREDGIRKKNAEKRFRERACRRYFHKMPGPALGGSPEFRIFAPNDELVHARIRTKYRCGAASDPLRGVLELHHAVPPRARRERSRHRPLAPLLGRIERRGADAYAATVPAHRAPVAAGDDGGMESDVRPAPVGRPLRLSGTGTGPSAAAPAPHVRAARTSRALTYVPPADAAGEGSPGHARRAPYPVSIIRKTESNAKIHIGGIRYAPRRRGASCHGTDRRRREAKRRTRLGHRHGRPDRHGPRLRDAGRQRNHRRHRRRRLGTLHPERPAHGTTHAHRGRGRLQIRGTGASPRSRRNGPGRLRPGGGGACRRGDRRLGQPHGDQQKILADDRFGGLRKTFRSHRLVQPGRNDEFPVGTARRKQLRQLRHDTTAHQRPRRPILAGAARQPPDLQLPGRHVRFGTASRLDDRTRGSDPRRRFRALRGQRHRRRGEHHHQGAAAQLPRTVEHDEPARGRRGRLQHGTQRVVRLGRLPRGGLPLRHGPRQGLLRPQRRRILGHPGTQHRNGGIPRLLQTIALHAPDGRIPPYPRVPPRRKRTEPSAPHGRHSRAARPQNRRRRREVRLFQSERPSPRGCLCLGPGHRPRQLLRHRTESRRLRGHERRNTRGGSSIHLHVRKTAVPSLGTHRGRRIQPETPCTTNTSG